MRFPYRSTPRPRPLSPARVPRRVLTGALVLWCMASGAPSAAQQRDTATSRVAGREPWRTDFSRRAVPLTEIVSGGPPRDGIPSIDRPRFETARTADRWLADRDPVVVVQNRSVVRAYPLAILIWHEIVNDVVGGLPVAVTFCPLCNTALVFDRRVGVRVLDFGTTGRLRHSDMVMYDRQTETWWQQVTGEAIVGELVGTELRDVPANTLGWKEARTLFPQLQVLSRDTGHRRDYGRNPYVGYDEPRGSPIPEFFRGRSDARLPAMARVVAVELGEGWAAPLDRLRQRRVAEATVAGTPLVALWKAGAASALDRSAIAEGREVGQTAVYDRRAAGRVLTFRPVRGGFRDHQTGSGWNLAGRAVDGPLRGQRLRPVAHGDHFWFAWAVFRPETEVWSPD